MSHKKLLQRMNRMKEKISRLTDEELQQEVETLKKLIEKKNTEEEVLIQAFALIREANYRVLGLFPTDEQVLGALVLYDGEIAEMKTGEGKSLVILVERLLMMRL